MSISIRKLDSTDPDFKVRLSAVLAFDTAEDESVDRVAAAILAAVKTRGDAAVLEYTNQFDRLGATSIASLEISQHEIQAALSGLPPTRRAALQTAADRVRSYHERQKRECGSDGFEFTESDGTLLGQKVTALDRVGIYVPGGKAAYPSSVLMNAIPAKVAGVQEVIMVVPTPDGVKQELVLAAAALSGVDRIFTIGGAQAIGALAFGTDTIPQVDKIVGPGNAYVAAAKRRVFGTVGIDMIAGPSEILIICDGSTDPDWIAMDLFSQAEHDELAQSILICPDDAYIDKVAASIDRQIDSMPRKEVIRTSLINRGAMIKVRDMAEACEIANLIAPEHLEISTENPQQWADQVRHAGAMFLGRYSSESLGDYCAGPNHVLPTSRTARFSSPLGVYDFQKRSSVIHVSQAGAQTLGKIASELAHGEGLQAHAKSAEFDSNELPRAVSDWLNQVFCEDALTGLARVPDGAIDLIVADPPYGLGKDYGNESDKLDATAYLLWMEKWIDAALPKLKANGSLYIFLTWRYSPEIFVMLKQRMSMINEIIWDRRVPSMGGSTRRFSSVHDTIGFFAKSKDYYFDVDAVRIPYDAETKKARSRSIFVGAKWLEVGYNPKDVWSISRLHREHRERADHPTQKPLEIVDRMIKASCPPGGVVLDPFMGSGTTGVAAARCGRDFVGFELNPEYCGLIQQRLAKLAEERAAPLENIL